MINETKHGGEERYIINLYYKLNYSDILTTIRLVKTKRELFVKKIENC